MPATGFSGRSERSGRPDCRPISASSSRASATNRPRCSGDSVARKSSIRAVVSRFSRSRSSNAASNEPKHLGRVHRRLSGRVPGRAIERHDLLLNLVAAPAQLGDEPVEGGTLRRIEIQLRADPLETLVETAGRAVPRCGSTRPPATNSTLRTSDTASTADRMRKRGQLRSPRRGACHAHARRPRSDRGRRRATSRTDPARCRHRIPARSGASMPDVSMPSVKPSQPATTSAAARPPHCAIDRAIAQGRVSCRLSHGTR